MPIRSIKNKINDIASGEILGETFKEQQKRKSDNEAKTRAKAEIKSAQKVDKKESKERKSKEKKQKKQSQEKQVSKESLFKRKNIEEVEEIKEDIIIEKDEVEESEIMIKDAVEGYKDVLSILNIKEKLNLDVDFKSNDLDYIEFSQTTPLGFDFDEVTDFITRVKYTLNKYESVLAQRDKEIVLVASEVKKVEEKMIEQNQARELDKIIGGMTIEEKLYEENAELQIELNNLKAKFIDNKSNSSVVEKLEREIKLLRTENEMLTMNTVKLPPHQNDSKNEQKNSLPVFDEPEKEMPAFKDSNVQLPFYDEEEDKLLDEMITDGQDNFEKMMKNL